MTAAAPLHHRELDRLTSVCEHLEFAGQSDPALTALVEATARELSAPIAALSLIGDDLQVFQATVGFEGNPRPRAESLCAWVVAQDDVLEVPDLLEDLRFRDGTVAGLGVRAYAGAPVYDTHGLPVGVLCVFDVTPRSMSHADLIQLEQLAEAASVQFELLQLRALGQSRTTAPRQARQLANAPVTGLPNAELRTDTSCPSPSALRVLLVEDSAADAELVAEMLSESVPDVVLVHVTRLDDAVAALAAQTFDVALLDLSLPDAEGLEVLARIRQVGDAAVGAVVVLTGRDEDDLAITSLLGGAQDYLLKSELTPRGLARALRYAASRAHAEEEVRSSRAWAQSVLNSIDAPTCALDQAGTIVATNVAWERFATSNDGEPAQTGIGTSYLAVCDSVDDPAVQALGQDLRRLLATGTGRIELDYPCHSPDEQRWFSLRATPAVGGGAAVITHVNITALKRAQDDLGHAAMHDPLTGLANRRLLVQDLDRRLRASEPDRVVAVLFLDVDRFKLVNDSCGHTIGDALLVRIAAELSAAVRPDDLVARHGGDEFVVLADVQGAAEAAALADRVQAATCQTVVLEGCQLSTSSSLGLVVSAGVSPATADDILTAVDAAMHEAKRHGRGRIEVYSEELRDRARTRGRRYRELVAAVEQEQFRLYYQPIVVPQLGGVHIVEALLRWQHPELGPLAPNAFLDVAESTGLIIPIGAWVIREACRQGRELHDSGLHLGMSVNLSAKQINDPTTLDHLREALRDSGFPPTSLIIEVTETSMIDDTENALTALQTIKDLGVQLVVDDFGIGYSSMAYLRRYPVDGIKIDRSFVQDMLDNDDDRAIVASIVKLASDLDLWVVAEGVETPEQLECLTSMGCELIQGYLYSRPVPADRLGDVARRLSRPAVPPAKPHSARERACEVDEVEPALLARMVRLAAEGASLHTVAAMFNSEGLRTSHGLRWHPRSVARSLAAADR